jgi:hypothetical protein
MDFPVCPSCRQSVIDDDAVDCPFCGASMKAKPGAKPAPTPTKSPAAASRPALAKPASGVTKPTLPGDDLPFESELTTGKSAILAMPNPTKNRTLQVICPMCDTPGYLPPTAAGQSVRCANSKCVMPVFTAPSEKKKEEPPAPPPPPKPSNLPMIGAITLAVLGLFAAGIYMTMFHKSGTTQKVLSDEEKQMILEMAGSSKKNPAVKPNPADVGPQPPKDNEKSPKTVDKTAQSNEELIKTALKQMKDSSLAADKQRSKPYCRQLAAEANAVTGNAATAREHLDQLSKVGPAVTYYRVIPLLDLFWGEFSAGDKSAASKTLNSAVSEVSKLPKFGRTRLEIVGRVVAALAAADRIPEALTILSGFQSSEPEAQLAARLQMATDGKLGRLTDSNSVLPWKNPQAVAATSSLIARGQFSAATAWIAAQTNDEAKAECLSVWAQETAFLSAGKGELDADGTIAAAVENLAPAFAARVWARAGCGRVLAKDQIGAAAAGRLAQEKLALISSPAEPTMPSIKQTAKFPKEMPAAEPLFQAAAAAGELAFLQVQSQETKSDAEKSLEQALSFVRATAPTFAAAQQRQDEAERLGPVGLRDLLKKELKLKSDDDARTNASNYKRALTEIVDASQRKFAIESELLSRLRGAGVGLNEKVWIVVSTRSTADDINRRENFFATGLPGELIEGLKGTSEEQAILGAWSLRSKAPTPPRPALVELNELLKSNLPAAVEFAQSIENKTSHRDELLLRTASYFPTVNQLSTAFQFIGKLDDPVAREECYRFAAALAVQRGQSEEVWKQVTVVTQNTEKVALCRGLVAGLQFAGKFAEELPDSTRRP